MIKTALKNFFRSFVFLFIPMGIVYLFLIIAAVFFASSFVRATGELLGDVTELIRLSVAESSVSVGDFLAYAFSEIDWNGNFFEVLANVVDSNWLQNTVRGFFETLSASTEGFESSLAAIVDGYTGKLVAYVAVAASVLSLGIYAAGFATRYALRRRTARRNVKQFIIAHTLVPLFQSLILIAALVLIAVMRIYGILLFTVFLFLGSALSLIAAWLIHGGRKFPLKKVLTVRNIASSLAVTAILLAAIVLLALLLFFISPLLSILLTLPFAIYCINIADVNAESFVRSLAEEGTP